MNQASPKECDGHVKFQKLMHAYEDRASKQASRENMDVFLSYKH